MNAAVEKTTTLGAMLAIGRKNHGENDRSVLGGFKKPILGERVMRTLQRLEDESGEAVCRGKLLWESGLANGAFKKDLDELVEKKLVVGVMLPEVRKGGRKYRPIHYRLTKAGKAKIS